MILSTKKLSPVKAGIYKAKILDIKEYSNVPTKKGLARKLLFSFVLFTDAGIIELKTNMFINELPDSKFTKFKKSVLAFFNTDTLDTDDHIGITVKAKFSIKIADNGDEYPQLEWYAPYTNNLDENEKLGGKKDEQ